jgi:peptidoglycan/LPS O-acetylase OafA/YrhL
MSNPTRIAEVEGLRGLAIALVVIFHFFPSALAGGFLGVDIFFVISGFVITQRLLRDFEAGRGLQVLPEFYMARIRRLFPALAVVLLFSLSLGWIGFFSDEYAVLGAHAMASASFTVNTHLAQELGYFGAEAITKPLLHLWSIAVEMQFYLLWPLALLASLSLAGSMPPRLIPNLACLSLGLGSLAVCLYSSPATPDAGYFSTLARAWEFLIGAQLGLLLQASPKSGTGERSTKAAWATGLVLFLGLGLIAYGLLSVEANKPPGLHSLYPTLGAALLLFSAPRHRLGRALFGNSLATGLGKISYSLYLWHWPLLSFAAVLNSERPSVLQSLGLVALAVLLSVLSYLFVEKPARRLNQLKTLLVLFLPMLGLSAAGAAVHEAKGFPVRLGERERFVAYFENKAPSFQYFLTKIDILKNYRMECNFFDIQGYVTGKLTNRPIDAIAPTCTTPESRAGSTLLLWGDSHAQQYWYGINATKPQSLNVLMVASSGCAPKAHALTDSTDDYCVRSNYVASQTIAQQKPSLVLLARQSGYSLEEAREAAKELEAQFKGQPTQFVFMAATPTWKADLPRVMARHWWDTKPERSYDKLQPASRRQALQKESDVRLSERSLWLNTLHGLCNNQGCLTFVGSFSESQLTSWDYGHLTPVASEFLASQWLMPRLQAALPPP